MDTLHRFYNKITNFSTPTYPVGEDPVSDRRHPRCNFAEFATYRNRHTAIISHALRISRLPCKHIALCFRILFRGQSGVSNPFRGERDHREHTAKRCWNAVPYGMPRFLQDRKREPITRLSLFMPFGCLVYSSTAGLYVS